MHLTRGVGGVSGDKLEHVTIFRWTQKKDVVENYGFMCGTLCVVVAEEYVTIAG